MRRSPATIAGRRLTKTGSARCAASMMPRPALSSSSRPRASTSASFSASTACGIGRVDPERAPLLVAEPDRHRRGGEHRAHRLDLGREQLVARLELGARQRSPVRSRKRTSAGRADRAAAGLDQAAGRGGDGQGEGLAALAERVRRRGRAGRPIPAAARCRRRGRRRGRPARRSRRAARRRRAALARRASQATRRWSSSSSAISALGGGLEAGDARAERVVLGLGAVAGADQRDGADDARSRRRRPARPG